MMNLFRKSDQDIDQKITNYEIQISELVNQINEQNEKITTLTSDVFELMNKVSEKETVISEKVDEIESKETVITKQESLIEKQDEIINDVVSNTLSVEKQAALKAAIILGEMGSTVVETLEAPVEVDIMKQLKNLRGKELTQFYSENKSQIFKKLKV